MSINNKFKNPLSELNESVYSHLLGEKHTPRHRRIAGIIIMVFGVGLVKCAYAIPFEVIHFIGDGMGYFIHGVGGLPIVEWWINKHKNGN